MPTALWPRLEPACQAKQEELQEVRRQLAENRKATAELHKQLGQLRERQSGATERAAVLEELEKRLEGLSAGVKQLLVAAQDGHRPVPIDKFAGSWPICCTSISRPPRWWKWPWARWPAVWSWPADATWSNSLQAIGFAGRPRGLDSARRSRRPRRTWTASTCTAARACWAAPTSSSRPRRNSPCWPAACWAKLGSWRRLSHALTLAESAGRGFHFVTRAGELVAADGTLFIGPRHASTGLISRRAELRVLRQQIAETAAQIEKRQTTVIELDGQIAAGDARQLVLGEEHKELSDQLHQQRLRTGAAEERLSQIDKQHQSVDAEVTAAELEHERARHRPDRSAFRTWPKSKPRWPSLESRVSEGTSRASPLGANAPAQQPRGRRHEDRRGQERTAAGPSPGAAEPARARSAGTRQGPGRWPRAPGNFALAPTARRTRRCWRPSRNWPSSICAKKALPPKRPARTPARTVARRKGRTRARKPSVCAARCASSKADCTPRNWWPAKCATNERRWPIACAKTTASNWPDRARAVVGGGIARARSGRTGNRRLARQDQQHRRRESRRLGRARRTGNALRTVSRPSTRICRAPRLRS